MSCPYSLQDVKGGEWSVISFNKHGQDPHRYDDENLAVIAGGTATGAEIAGLTGVAPSHANLYDHPDYDAVRRPGIVEKCIFCDHRTKHGEEPFCAASCPSGARVFGYINDPSSEAAKLLKKYDAEVLKPEAGTKTNVYYICSFQAK